VTDVAIRPAVTSDIPAIVAMLADDELGATRESPDDLAPYYAAFARLAQDPNQFLVVAVRDEEPVGTLQLTLISGLSRRGATRALIESVRVHRSARGAGIGEQMIRWAITESERRGGRVVQLTSDKSRSRAHRFYERLGFTASHIGFKLQL
jgi:ribosomal protein S18 acetylase RimI-like enzyme